MSILSNLQNTHRPAKPRKRVGRGVGSKLGKTCGRGHKGDKSRSGYKRRYGNEGGQFPLYKKLPIRGFTNGRFKQEMFSINLDRISEAYEDGETVNLMTLINKGLFSVSSKAKIKILGNGQISKKVLIEADIFSKGAIEKLQQSSIEFKVVC
jgi:large subunit ribosomal protein L15